MGLSGHFGTPCSTYVLKDDLITALEARRPEALAKDIVDIMADRGAVQGPRGGKRAT
jgi:hypothetical protein